MTSGWCFGANLSKHAAAVVSARLFVGREVVSLGCVASGCYPVLEIFDVLFDLLEIERHNRSHVPIEVDTDLNAVE